MRAAARRIASGPVVPICRYGPVRSLGSMSVSGSGADMRERSGADFPASIRLARPDELDALAAIELDAALSLIEAGVPLPGGPGAMPRHLLEAALSEALLFAATGPGDRPLGFLAAHERDGGLYIGELDVLRAWQRRGIGRALVAAALGEARTRSLWGAMLTTDRFVPFNFPFYVSLGFREAAGDTMPPGLARVLAEEAAAGMEAARCVGMVLRFDGV